MADRSFKVLLFWNITLNLTRKLLDTQILILGKLYMELTFQSCTVQVIYGSGAYLDYGIFLYQLI